LDLKEVFHRDHENKILRDVLDKERCEFLFFGDLLEDYDHRIRQQYHLDNHDNTKENNNRVLLLNYYHDLWIYEILENNDHPNLYPNRILQDINMKDDDYMIHRIIWTKIQIIFLKIRIDNFIKKNAKKYFIDWVVLFLFKIYFFAYMLFFI